MAHYDDEDLEDAIKKIEAMERKELIKQEAEKLFYTWVGRVWKVCRTSTIAILAIAAWLGNVVASNSERVMLALEALFGSGGQ